MTACRLAGYFKQLVWQ